MRLPKSRAEKLRKPDDGPVHMTAAGIERVKRTIARLEQELPGAIKEVARTKEYGDFSENAEYKEAKHKLRKMHARIFSLKDRLRRAEVIDESSGQSGTVQLGATVTVEVKDKKYQYQIVGPHEADPASGRISHVSPLGSALLGHTVDECVSMTIKDREVVYRIMKIQ